MEESYSFLQNLIFMEDIKGTNVPSKLVPYTSSDKYATHDEEYGRGGYRAVSSVADMNAIPTERRKGGMLVYVKNEDKYYRLTDSNAFVDAGLKGGGGSGGEGSVEKYIVDADIIPLTNIVDGDRITSSQSEEIGRITEAWALGKIVTYVDVNRSPVFMGILNVFFEPSDAILTMSFPYMNGIIVYQADIANSVWTVMPIDGVGGGGGGSSKIYKTGLPLGDIAEYRNNTVVSQTHRSEILNIIQKYKDGYVVIAADESGGYIWHYGIIDVYVSDDRSECIFNYTINAVTHVTIWCDLTQSNSKWEVIKDQQLSPGQNGYQKFSSGLLIQWGQDVTTTTGQRGIIFPISFYDTNYAVTFSIYANGINIENAIYSSALIMKYTGRLVYANRFYNGGYGYSGLSTNWIAIGRWK